jgi:hypothetical protein
MKIVFNIFWPLAFSWLFMAVDNPSVSAIVSRMADPEINLAAHGSIVYPISLIIEAPIIMMLSMSLALCKDKVNYRRLYKFMMTMCAALTIVHALVAFTPLYYVVVRDIIGAPPEILANARIGLMIMLPWTWAIGFRRFYQGILIYCGFSKKVTVGTFIRMICLLSTLFIGYFFRDHLTGAIVGGSALAVGVVAEAIYIGKVGVKVAAAYLPDGEEKDLISWKELFSFTAPLVPTQLINLGWMSLGSAAMSRMVNPIASLAVWPVLSGMINILRSFGNACNETTLSVVAKEGYYTVTRKFTFFIGLFCSFLYLLILLTPLGDFWFINLSSLPPNLVALAKQALPLIFLIPLVNAMLNFFQAILLAGKKTSGFLESLLLFLFLMLIIFGIGIKTQRWEGIFVILFGMNIATTAQMLWTAFRARSIIRQFS